MSSRQRQSHRRRDGRPHGPWLPPVRNIALRRRQLLVEDAESDALEFIEEYDASGHHLRLERLPR